MLSDLKDAPAAWRAEDLQADQSWTFNLNDRARRDLVAALRKAHETGKKLLDSAR